MITKQEDLAKVAAEANKSDPNNADAQYILGELARRDEKWDEAISRFSAAAKIKG